MRTAVITGYFATYNIITNVAMLVDSGVASALTIGAVNLLQTKKWYSNPYTRNFQ